MQPFLNAKIKSYDQLLNELRSLAQRHLNAMFFLREDDLKNRLRHYPQSSATHELIEALAILRKGDEGLSYSAHEESLLQPLNRVREILDPIPVTELTTEKQRALQETLPKSLLRLPRTLGCYPKIFNCLGFTPANTPNIARLELVRKFLDSEITHFATVPTDEGKTNLLRAGRKVEKLADHFGIITRELIRLFEDKMTTLQLSHNSQLWERLYFSDKPEKRVAIG